MNVGIISISNKVIRGNIVDFHPKYISEQLFDNGIEVKQIITTADETEYLINNILKMIESFDTVILIGQVKHLIEIYSKAVNIEISEKDTIENWYKTKYENKHIYFLTDSPKSITTFFEANVKPEIIALFNTKVFMKQLKLFTFPQLAVEEKLSDLFPKYNDVNFYIINKFPETLVKITGKNEKTVNEAFIESLKLFEDCIFATEDVSLPEVVHNLLVDSNYTLAGVESCTGGMVSSILTDFSNSSKYFKYTIVSYSNNAKETILNIPEEIINTKGAVSKATVVGMFDGLEYLLPASLAYAITGVAGPLGGTEEKPVGTVFIGIMSFGRRDVTRFQFSGTRDQIRKLSAWAALKLIYDKIKKIK